MPPTSLSDPTLPAAPSTRSLAPVVVAVSAGSPADTAGVQQGDEIVRVNGDVHATSSSGSSPPTRPTSSSTCAGATSS